MYPQLSRFSDGKLLIVNDDCEETMVVVCVQAGCGQEPLGKNGVAHLVEHICLAYENYISSNYEHTYKNIKFCSTGYTNYGQTVLMFTFQSHLENIYIFSRLLRTIMDADIVTEDTFKLSQTEILDECMTKKSQWEWQREIITYITNNQVQNLPVGSEDEIKKLHFNDVISYIKDFYNMDNIGIVFFTNILSQDIIPIIKPEKRRNTKNKYFNFQIKKISRNIINKNDELSLLQLNHPFKLKTVEIYFHKPYISVNLKRKLTRMLFEIISKNCIEKYIEKTEYCNYLNNLSVSDKYVSDYFYFAVFSMEFSFVDDKITLLANGIVNHLKKANLTERVLVESKKRIIPFLNEYYKSSREQLFQNISSHFFYGEPIHITREHYRDIEEIMDEISIGDILNYRNWILEESAKIVIST
ncbi:insulinase family protein [Paenibacillus graminis]|uniref:Peptidase M16 N-terminal domain-containing protein n=1 Tax=Paenibacillus graminis TaxID=189425 RepID=A0A089M900_9BACL|nr:insulinase family protein [Paenibacillus graminis]AIQ69737.1 hypothetical protein PGRAT_20475 [Paenibacillus graminis]